MDMGDETIHLKRDFSREMDVEDSETIHLMRDFSPQLFSSIDEDESESTKIIQSINNDDGWVR